MIMQRVKRIFSLLGKLVNEFKALGKHYSHAYAFYNLLWWLCFYFRTPLSFRISSFAIKRKTVWLDRYIGEKYADVLEAYNNPAENPIHTEIYRIWIFWGQGEGAMPLLIKACYNQLKKNNVNVHLVTNENLKEYVDLPDAILQKVADGRISYAHFSDIVRMTLLSKYGGLWLDATVWVPGQLPIDELSSMTLFSANGPSSHTNKSIRFWTSYQWNWSGWCIGTNRRNSLLFSFVSDMLINIAQREMYLLDYVLIDYLIYYACRKFPSVSKEMDKIKIVPCVHRNDLASIMNKPYNVDTYNELIATDFAFKLSFRTQWQSYSADGAPTFYGKLIEKNPQNELNNK